MYKSSNFRKSQPAQDSPTDKYRAQAKQLQEAFPSWSYDDIQSLLVETGGDVEVASTRIIEGHAEQWGSVTRKKDKKSSAPSHPKDSSAGRERGDFRGGRGGRAARGGPRGGAARGASARGGHHEVNGHRAKPSLSAQPTKDTASSDAPATTAANGEVVEPDSEAPSAWGSSTPATWGGDTATINGATHHPAPAATPSTAPAPAPAQAHASAPVKVVSTPATSKLSWAQIARKPQEKPAPSPAPAPPQAPVSVPTPPPAPVQPSEPAPEAEEPAPTSTGWEEPTTVQAPTWDDEPRPPQQAEAVSAPAVVEEPQPQESSPKREEEPLPERSPSAGPPGIVQQPAAESPAAHIAKPLTPAVSTRPTPVSHRSNAKFKTSDQPVVLPASFGSGVEKIGMQFGSLSLGGEDFDAPGPDASPVEPKAVQQAAPEPAAAPVPAPAPAPVQPPEPAAPVASPPTQAPIASTPLFQSSLSQPPQQPQPQQPPALPPVSQPAPQSSLPSSLSQPSLSSQSSLPSSTSASISPYSQHSQASLAGHQLTQSHLSYGQQGLTSHLDQVHSQPQHATPVSQPQQQQPAQAQNIGGPSSYFRQPEAPYFHTPTPPAGQSQDSPYGSFGQHGQHQGQGSHLGNFSGQDYGYGETQRNFYDSYSAPTGFSNRNVLHDDIKGLPGSQQPHVAPGLPPANTQSSQQHPPSSQTSSQGQPSAGQGPQQGYPPPLPYYYPPYPQNQYYGSPYSSGYTVPQPFVKYPTVFQGPPGPQSAPSPATKQGPSSVQPQSPYGQSLYGQQPHSNAYDEVGYQHHTQHSLGQNVNVGSGLPSGEYGKHQYGSGGQGMQGFMGLGQSSAPTSGPPLGQRATAGSPETAYKPYGGNVGVKDVGAGVGVGQGGVGQGLQGRGGVQQPSQGSFYAAQRFGASQAGGPQGQQAQQPQGQGPQGHLGYPQSGSDGSTFYSYQPRQQQGYWQ